MPNKALQPTPRTARLKADVRLERYPSAPALLTASRGSQSYCVPGMSDLPPKNWSKLNESLSRL